MKKLLILSLFCSTQLFAQIEVPAGSPTFEVKGKIALADVTLTYSRPSAKGRKIFGDLVPFGAMWRTGANAATKLSISRDMEIEGHAVPAGEYALYTIPGQKSWTIILSKNTSWWGTMGYDESEDLVRFEVPTKSTSSHYETFTISFSDFTNHSANLNMKWEKTKVIINLSMEIDDLVMAQIQEKLIDNPSPNPNDYYTGASYYYETNRDAKQALKWINKSLENDKTYWMLYLKANILVRLNKDKEAIATAKESMQMASGGVNPDYVRLNEKLIASLSK